MALTRTPRDSWVEEGLRALGVGGPDAVRIEKLAQALGVTKGGFYWHFDGRTALLEEMLDAWERAVIDEVMRRVDNRRMDYMRELFGGFCPDDDEVEWRCMVAFSLWIGNHFIAADHGPRTRAEVMELVLNRLEA